MKIRPVDGVSRPASSRSAVVLPQPEGPSRARNVPSGTSSVSGRSAGVPAKDFETLS